MNEHDREAYLCTSEEVVVYRNHMKKSTPFGVLFNNRFSLLVKREDDILPYNIDSTFLIAVCVISILPVSDSLALYALKVIPSSFSSVFSIFLTALSASSSLSVLSAARKETEKETLFLPSPTCAPR